MCANRRPRRGWRRRQSAESRSDSCRARVPGPAARNAAELACGAISSRAGASARPQLTVDFGRHGSARVVLHGEVHFTAAPSRRPWSQSPGPAGSQHTGAATRTRAPCSSRANTVRWPSSPGDLCRRVAVASRLHVRQRLLRIEHFAQLDAGGPTAIRNNSRGTSRRDRPQPAPSSWPGGGAVPADRDCARRRPGPPRSRSPARQHSSTHFHVAG